MSQTIQFPSDFLWGSATSAYQIEGSPLADGAGPSIWQRYCAVPGNMKDGDTGDIACDHYNRYQEDVALMARLGLKAYRFSVSWSRILPQGRGAVNQAGLDFYSRLIDELLAHGIEPMLTLYHWDLPAALDNLGGWLNPDIADWFTDYARVLFKAFDGRVKSWATLNEPWVVTDGGYMHGTLAPGHRSLHEAALASHNLMRAHGSAVKAYREAGRHQIGIVVNIEPKYPASQSPADLDATRRADAYMNRQYLDPIFLGGYPPELRQMFGDAWPEWPAADFELIGQRLDFVGINYYTRSVVRDEPSNWPLKVAPVRQNQATYTETGWEVFPQGLTDTLVGFKQRYGDTPLYIMENGSAFYDPPNAEQGRVHDPLRVDCLRKNMDALSKALALGVDVRGYMVWSLLDNLEWSHGFSKRFGIIHVNFATQQRTLKDSAYLYADIVASNGACLNSASSCLTPAE